MVDHERSGTNHVNTEEISCATRTNVVLCVSETRGSSALPVGSTSFLIVNFCFGRLSRAPMLRVLPTSTVSSITVHEALRNSCAEMMAPDHTS